MLLLDWKTRLSWVACFKRVCVFCRHDFISRQKPSALCSLPARTHKEFSSLSSLFNKKSTPRCFFWSGRRDSNSRQPAWKAGTLPLSYFRLCLLFFCQLFRSQGISPDTLRFVTLWTLSYFKFCLLFFCQDLACCLPV